MTGFMIDPNRIKDEKARNAKVVTLYCCDKDAKALESNDESFQHVPFRFFWTKIKYCENIKVISIPGDLEIKIDTLKERLPHLESVTIRIAKEGNTIEEHRLSAEEFRSFFSQRLIEGENGVSTNDLPDHQRRPYNIIVPYRPDIYPNIKKANICKDAYEALDYKFKGTPSSNSCFVNQAGLSSSQPEVVGILYIGMEIIQLAKDCVGAIM